MSLTGVVVIEDPLGQAATSSPLGRRRAAVRRRHGSTGCHERALGIVQRVAPPPAPTAQHIGRKQCEVAAPLARSLADRRWGRADLVAGQIHRITFAVGAAVVRSGRDGRGGR